MTEDEIRALAGALSCGDVVIYTQPGCRYCDMAKQCLDSHGIQYIECDIHSDPDCAAAFKSFLATGTPYVVVRRAGKVRHLRDGFTSSAFLAALL